MPRPVQGACLCPRPEREEGAPEELRVYYPRVSFIATERHAPILKLFASEAPSYEHMT